MGREVRHVPADWVHPQKENGKPGYQPMFDQSFAQAVKAWKEDFLAWESGYNACFNRQRKDSESEEFWECEGNPPDRAFYQPDWPQQTCTHFQMYETTTEGTPISPVMETPELLAQWLVDNSASGFGDMTASYDSWLRVAQGGYACSMVSGPGGLKNGVDGLTPKPNENAGSTPV